MAASSVAVPEATTAKLQIDRTFWVELKITFILFDSLANSPKRSDFLFKAKIISVSGFSFT